MTESVIHILMTGAGAPGAAGIIHCLRQLPAVHITVADARPATPGRLLADDFILVPKGDEPGFTDTLLAACREKNIHLIMPLVTRELLPLAGRIPEFELAGATVMVSPASSLEIAIDKGRLYQFLQWRGMAVPDFRLVENVDQFINAAHELGYPERAICFKPCQSNGSRGFRILDPSADEQQLLFAEKPGTAHITFDEAVRILSKQPFPELLLTEYLPGDEYSVDCLADAGQPIVVVPRIRRRIVNGISAEGEFLNEKDLIDYSGQVIRELKLHGNIGIQFRRSATGFPGILEINPRVQGTISAALGAGVNLPVLAVRQALHLPIRPEETAVQWGTRFSRYWTEVFYPRQTDATS